MTRSGPRRRHAQVGAPREGEFVEIADGAVDEALDGLAPKDGPG